MSVETDMLYISVIGPKANVTRMLNEAIRQKGAGQLIVEADDIETINRKLTGKDGKPGMMVHFADLIDQKCLEDDAILKEKWQTRVIEPSDEDFNLDIELIKVQEYDPDSYEVKFSEYLPEWIDYYDCIDWAGWKDIARVYGCRVFIDDNYYRNGVFMRFECATIYEPTDDDVKQTRLESGETRQEYDEFMDKLVELYPKRYIPIRARYLKEKEDEAERQHLEEERHIKLNYTVWSNFASWEEDGVKAIKGVYDELIGDSLINYLGISADDIVMVLKIRAEKWNGVNDEFAECYEELIRNFNDDYEQKRKELEAEEAEMNSFDEDKWLKEILNDSDEPSEKPDIESAAEEENDSLYPIDENGHAVIPEGTTRIEDYAFLQCNKLVSVSIPDTVVEIGEGAFGSCENLTSITLPPSLKLIDELAFCGCKKLTEIEIPLGVKIADNAFKDCPCEEVVMKKTK